MKTLLFAAVAFTTTSAALAGQVLKFPVAECKQYNETTQLEETLKLFAKGEKQPSGAYKAISVYGGYQFNSQAGNGHGFSEFSAKIIKRLGSRQQIDLSVQGKETFNVEGSIITEFLNIVYIDLGNKTVSLQTKDDAANSRTRTVKCSKFSNLSLFN